MGCCSVVVVVIAGCFDCSHIFSDNSWSLCVFLQRSPVSFAPHLEFYAGEEEGGEEKEEEEEEEEKTAADDIFEHDSTPEQNDQISAVWLGESGGDIMNEKITMGLRGGRWWWS